MPNADSNLRKTGVAENHSESQPGQTANFIDLPPVLQRVEFRHLFTLEVAVDALQAIGDVEGLKRRVGPIASGRFEGQRLKGRVAPGGSDWQMATGENMTHLDARIVLETDVGELIGMTFGGIRCGPPDVMVRLARGEFVDPTEYYFRIHATFSTGANALGWMNRMIAIGTGHRLPGGPIYNLFEDQ
ncbi:DUF3237 domain-containing protein [Rhizobium leucaenae]|uniref:DUF3237 domain-containing protein n=1 Tax=Rhizobium leucaenae TaxID=29450 RepID=UPI0017CB0A43|nr:DUF3237 domain-containing protein [Rhizobium leucaenae]MBB6305488.1 hypothetical protein [Rhizobium leucaenae]